MHIINLALSPSELRGLERLTGGYGVQAEIRELIARAVQDYDRVHPWEPSAEGGLTRCNTAQSIMACVYSTKGKDEVGGWAWTARGDRGWEESENAAMRVAEAVLVAKGFHVMAPTPKHIPDDSPFDVFQFIEDSLQTISEGEHQYEAYAKYCADTDWPVQTQAWFEEAIAARR